MNYQLFSSLSPSQLASTKNVLTTIIENNLTKTSLDNQEQVELDNLMYLVGQMNDLAAKRPLILLAIA